MPVPAQRACGPLRHVRAGRSSLHGGRDRGAGPAQPRPATSPPSTWATSCARVLALSFDIALRTWLRTVFGDTCSVAAISLVSSPPAISRTTCASRAVSKAERSLQVGLPLDRLGAGRREGVDRAPPARDGLDHGGEHHRRPRHRRRESACACRSAAPPAGAGASRPPSARARAGRSHLRRAPRRRGPRSGTAASGPRGSCRRGAGARRGSRPASRSSRTAAGTQPAIPPACAPAPEPSSCARAAGGRSGGKPVIHRTGIVLPRRPLVNRANGLGRAPHAMPHEAPKSPNQSVQSRAVIGDSPVSGFGQRGKPLGEARRRARLPAAAAAAARAPRPQRSATRRARPDARRPCAAHDRGRRAASAPRDPAARRPAAARGDPMRARRPSEQRQKPQSRS